MGQLIATLALLGVTAVWGLTFVVVHDAIRVWSVMGFLAVRFAIAGAVSGFAFGRRLDRSTLVPGAAIGLALAAGYLLQTWGLAFTTPTTSGLITGLFVVLAPILDRLLYGTRLRLVAWLAVALSLVGMTLLTGRLPSRLALGELLTVGCAIAFALHIALLSRHAPAHDPRLLGTAQMIGAGVVFLALWPLTGNVEAPPREVWFALVFTGVVASALAYLVQTAAQRRLSTAQTAVILTTEPVFAGIFGYLLAGERLAAVQYAGGILIIAALLLSELARNSRLGSAPDR